MKHLKAKNSINKLFYNYKMNNDDNKNNINLFNKTENENVTNVTNVTKNEAEKCNKDKDCLNKSVYDNNKSNIKSDNKTENINVTNVTNVTDLKAKYECTKCNFRTNRFYNYKKHLTTKKHLNTNKKQVFCNNCKILFNNRTSLFRHKKVCKSMSENKKITNTQENESLLDKVIHNQTLNNEKFNKILEILLQVTAKIAETTNVNKSHNNKSNNKINIINYLNTECKDAMNLSEFVEHLKITFKDLNFLGENTLVKSFDNTFVKQLKEVKQNKRPIHCSDSKRKKFYVKNEDKWMKDEGNKDIIRSFSQVITKFCTTLKAWKNENPEWLEDSETQDLVNNITMKIAEIYDEKTKNRIINLISNVKLVAKEISNQSSNEEIS
jgi:hypothetical protein